MHMGQRMTKPIQEYVCPAKTQISHPKCKLFQYLLQNRGISYYRILPVARDIKHAVELVLCFRLSRSTLTTDYDSITKTCLFKYIENFTTKI